LILFNDKLIILSKDAHFLKELYFEALLADNPKNIKIKNVMFDF